MSTTHDSSEPTFAPEIDETQNRESFDMETDHPDTITAVLEPPPVSQSVPSSQLPQNRIYGGRQVGVPHERSVRPRIELLEEDELFLSSQLQSFREASPGTCQRSRS